MFQSGMSECIDGDIVITQMPYTAFYAVRVPLLWPFDRRPVGPG